MLTNEALKEAPTMTTLSPEMLQAIREVALATAVEVIQQTMTVLPQQQVPVTPEIVEDATGRLHGPDGKFLPKATPKATPKAKAPKKAATKMHPKPTRKALVEAEGRAIIKDTLQSAKRALYRMDLTAAQHALVVEASTKNLIRAIIAGQLPLPKKFRIGARYYELLS